MGIRAMRCTRCRLSGSAPGPGGKGGWVRRLRIGGIEAGRVARTSGGVAEVVDDQGLVARLGQLQHAVTADIPRAAGHQDALRHGCRGRGKLSPARSGQITTSDPRGKEPLSGRDPAAHPPPKSAPPLRPGRPGPPAPAATRSEPPADVSAWPEAGR